MAIDAGDVKYSPGDIVTLDAGSNSVSKGDAVTFDGSGNISTASATGDDLVGVVHETADDGKVSVVISGLVVAVTVDSAVTAGDTLVPSSSTAGRFDPHTGGMYNANPDTGANAIAANHPFALEDAASSGDNVLAVFR